MSDSNNDKPPSPEEISKKLEEFIRSQFGSNVMFTSFREPGKDDPPPAPPAAPAIEETRDDSWLDFNLKPADIKAHLDRFVIRQDEAKKVLATAVCDHYHHARMMRDAESNPDSANGGLEFAKQNVLIIGPTGVGKTYLIKHIADLIGVPFVKADATKFSETGYVGADVDDLVRDLVSKAGGDIDLAEHGIIYLDEVDKLATSGERPGRDVSGRGVQTTLLKLMEETEVPLHAPNDMRSQMQMLFDMRRGEMPRKQSVNTGNILFVVSGSFSGLEKIVSRRLSRASIGFGASPREDVAAGDMLREARTQDFIDYGFEAEFVGRLPVRVVCDSLDADDLFEIMKSSEGSIIRQFEREFAAYGINAKFEDAALREMARRGAEENTGARALMTVWEKTLRDFKFELPSLGLRELAISEQLVKDPQSVLMSCRELAKTTQVSVAAREVEEFARQFTQTNGLEIRFDEAASIKIIERSEREGVPVIELCRRLFKDYPFGLHLIVSNTREKNFLLPVRAVEEPDRYLSDLVVASYRRDQNNSTGQNPTA